MLTQSARIASGLQRVPGCVISMKLHPQEVLATDTKSVSRNMQCLNRSTICCSYGDLESELDLVSHSCVPRSESSSDLFHIEFVFDSDVDCQFTIYNFLPDSVDLETLKNEYDVM